MYNEMVLCGQCFKFNLSDALAIRLTDFDIWFGLAKHFRLKI